MRALLLPALLLQAPAPVPEALEVRPGLFVLRGAPTEATYASLKAARIAYVINLRRDDEKGFDPSVEAAALAAVEVGYVRLALGRAPSRDDFELFRAILKDLPPGARILVHCADGNRAAAAVCAWMVLDQGSKPEEAVAIAKRAGLALPDTVKALMDYLARAKT